MSNDGSIITLLTDFGTSDYYVAAMKGVMLSIAPEVRIIDITHEVEPQNVLSGAYTLAGALPSPGRRISPPVGPVSATNRSIITFVITFAHRPNPRFSIFDAS